MNEYHLLFEHPVHSVIAAVLGALLLVAVFMTRRGTGPKASIFYVVGLTLTFLAATFVLGAPFLERREVVREIRALVDISDSMEEAVAEELLTRARRLVPNDGELRLLPFARDLAPLGVASSADSFADLRNSWGKLDRGNTDLQGAIDGAPLDGIPHLLITDGRGTIGDARAAALRRGSRGAIFPLVPENSDGGRPGFRISHLSSPLVAPANKSVEIRVGVQNSSSRVQRGTLQVFHDRKEVLRTTVEMAPGTEKLVLAESDPTVEGIREIRAILTPEDASFGETRESTFLSGEQREKILVLSGSPEDARFLVPALQSESYQVTDASDERAISSVGALDQYSAVVLNNIARAQLPPGLLQQFEQYVRGGGGLLMSGGDRSFGLGGYRGTSVEQLLPVLLVPPQTTKRRLNIAVELVIDKSRSMSFDNKLEYAKEAAREVVRTLKDDDFVGVIGFDAAPFNVFPLEQLASGRARALNRIGQLFPTGKTYLLPALDEARRALTRVEAGRKHMIVLTDGQLPDEGPVYTAQVRELRMLGLTVSTIMLGGDVDVSFLRSLAEIGGGAFYQTSDARNLPRIFLQDVKVSGGERTMQEDREYVVREGNGALRSTTIANFPPLQGYVQTKPRPEANLELVVVGLDKAEPLLASWKVERGKVVAFTSDNNGRWSEYWARWPRFQAFWSELVNSVRAPDAQRAAIRFNLRYHVESGNLNLDLAIFDEIPPGPVRATLIGPTGIRREIEFVAEARGRYRASIPGAMAGATQIEITAGGRRLTPVAVSLSGELFGERRGEGFDIPLLSEIAGMTGGVLNPSAAKLSERGAERRTVIPLTSWGAAVLLIFFVLTVIIRELGVRRKRRLPAVVSSVRTRA